MVVMPSGITYYENVQSSEWKRINCAFAKGKEEPLEWVQWSRPRRHTHYLQRRDDIVLIREDGLLRNFLFDKHSSKKFSTNNVIGHLGLSVDTAFCMLSGPPGKGGDILVVGGSMTDGGVFHVSARGSPERIQRIETLAPLNDIVTGPPIPIDAEDIAMQRGAPGRLYTCSGPHDRKGQVSEIRYGFEAQIGWKMEFPDAGLIDRLFSLELPDISEVLLLASHTASSYMVSFELETQDISFTDSESHPGFDFDHPTLAAAVFNRDIVIQITTAGISAILVEADDQVTRLRHLRSTFEHATISIGDDSVIAAIRACDTGFDLCMIEVETTEDGRLQFDVSHLVRLEHIPKSICCMQTDNGRLVVIGTATGELLCYNETLQPVFQHRIQDLHPEVKNAAVSSLVALRHNLVDPTLLLCGLRSGTVLCVELKAQSKDGMRIGMVCNCQKRCDC
jgi:hypothetical protein